jgi:predicted ATPase
MFQDLELGSLGIPPQQVIQPSSLVMTQLGCSRGRPFRDHRAFSAESETGLRRALDVARRQDAKSLELRAAMSLSRLWHQQGKRKEAPDLLAEVCGWLTDGFDAADLREAKALLEELT